MSLEVIIATVVGVLAGLGVIGALVFLLVWERCAIRRALANHPQPTEPPNSSGARPRGRDHRGVAAMRTTGC